MENYSPNKTPNIENRLAMQNALDINDKEISIGIDNFDESKGGQGDDDMERDLAGGTLNYTKGNFVGGRDKRMKFNNRNNEESPNVLSGTQKTNTDSNYEDEGFESMSIQ